MNAIGLELGEFWLSTNQQDIEQGGKGKNAQADKTNLANRNTNGNSENDETIIRMENDRNAYKPGTETQEREVLDTLQNFPESSRRGRCNSFSQTSSKTFETTRWDQTFMNNMNYNMQGVLKPSMMILQQGQDQE
ncbi:hypothetical protein O181_066702 [Austropuccinia psidii MF-1]|uniref:Uncharacterized protein n=1 Tax=Austropuccinia psidii MF-1 TaxID=1389203 RepID=A0A9Q3EVY4_9BASI|nr:hypothetical protein [Austropuccinia psidii MF-1]